LADQLQHSPQDEPSIPPINSRKLKMNPYICTIVALLLAGLYWQKSRIRLELAIYNEKRSAGELAVKSLRILPGQEHSTGGYIDNLYGWAGENGIRRKSDGSYEAYSSCDRYRSAPPDGNALYVNGRKVGRNQIVTIPSGAEVIRRDTHEVPPITRIRLC